MTTLETPMGNGAGEGRRKAGALAGGLSPAIMTRATKDAFVKLDPRKLTGNPVIFATWIVALLSTVSAVAAIASHQSAGFAVQIAGWLWATVLFANLAESVAEGRGKAAADSLRATRVTTSAKLITDEATGAVTPTPAHKLVPGSLIVEADRQDDILYLHALGTETPEDVEQVRAGVLAVEERIVRAIGSRDDVRRVNLSRAERSLPPLITGRRQSAWESRHPIVPAEQYTPEGGYPE